MSTPDLSHVPMNLGAGIGLRREFQEELPSTARPLDWLEILPENYLGRRGRMKHGLEACAARWRVIPHGVSLDLGGLDPLNEEYVDGVAGLCQTLDAPFFSDHLCFSRVDGVYLHDLLPLPFTREAATHVARRIEDAMSRVGRPFLLENPSYYTVMPGAEMTEAEMIRRVAEESGCGLLLDVNNVYVNATNLGYHALEFIDALPLERVRYVHLAGHAVRPEAIIDTHGTAVPDPVWALYEALLERIGPVSTLVEWDMDIPSLDAVLDEADKARALLRKHSRVEAAP